jgi:hypothetical protein
MRRILFMGERAIGPVRSVCCLFATTSVCCWSDQSGKCRAAAFGVIEEHALADLLVVDGNPIDDIELIAKPDKNFMIIMKDSEDIQRTRCPRRNVIGAGTPNAC